MREVVIRALPPTASQVPRSADVNPLPRDPRENHRLLPHSDPSNCRGRNTVIRGLRAPYQHTRQPYVTVPKARNISTGSSYLERISQSAALDERSKSSSGSLTRRNRSSTFTTTTRSQRPSRPQPRLLSRIDSDWLPRPAGHLRRQGCSKPLKVVHCRTEGGCTPARVYRNL